jgi:hypothetical protein
MKIYTLILIVGASLLAFLSSCENSTEITDSYQFSGFSIDINEIHMSYESIVNHSYSGKREYHGNETLEINDSFDVDTPVRMSSNFVKLKAKQNYGNSYRNEAYFEVSIILNPNSQIIDTLTFDREKHYQNNPGYHSGYSSDDNSLILKLSGLPYKIDADGNLIISISTDNINKFLPVYFGYYRYSHEEENNGSRAYSVNTTTNYEFSNYTDNTTHIEIKLRHKK